MKNWYRVIPYISLGLVSTIVLVLSAFIDDEVIKNILISIFSSSVFFFLAYLFYDLIRKAVQNREKKYLTDYIKNKISNDILVALYFLKKIIHGYNLDSNTLKNIFNTVNYSQNEILNSVKNQNYIGFQIFKDTNEVRSLFGKALNDNLILKYSSHADSICILRIANNLARLESILRDESNFNNCAESGVEFTVVTGKDLNADNDERFLLLKKTSHSDRFVVYDSGTFEEEKVGKLLSRYVLKDESAVEVAHLLFETFSLMKHWLPDKMKLSRIESRFRIIKDFFSPNTNSKSKKKEIYVADIIEIK